MTNIKLSLLLAGSLIIAGCSMTPEVNIPQPKLPSQQMSASQSISDKWWEQFGSSELNLAAEEALKNNSDLEQAAIRVARTRAAFRLSDAELMPSLNAQAGISKTQTSDYASPYTGAIVEDYSIGGSASFEIDLFGKLRDARNSAKATLLAETYNQESIRQAVIAQSVESYFSIVILSREEQIAEDTLKTRLETYDYRQKQFDKGATTELILRQAEAEVEATKVELYNIKNSLAQAQSAFALILGKSPKEIFESDTLTLSSNPSVLISIPKGLPSDLLERRADIQSALAQIKASNFALGSAKAAYFPSISLTGSAGFNSAELDDLFENGAGIWGIGGNLLTPIFDFGRISSQVESASENQKLALSTYVQTIRMAFKEVRDALNSHSLIAKRQEAQKRQIVALERTLELANRRFEEGYSSYLEVLDAERNLFSAKIALENSDIALLQATVALYKALGGGWKVPTKS